MKKIQTVLAAAMAVFLTMAGLALELHRATLPIVVPALRAHRRHPRLRWTSLAVALAAAAALLFSLRPDTAGDRALDAPRATTSAVDTLDGDLLDLEMDLALIDLED